MIFDNILIIFLNLNKFNIKKNIFDIVRYLE